MPSSGCLRHRHFHRRGVAEDPSVHAGSRLQLHKRRCSVFLPLQSLLSSAQFISLPLFFPFFIPSRLRFNFRFVFVSSLSITTQTCYVLHIKLDLSPHIFITVCLVVHLRYLNMADQRMTWDHDADKALLGCITDELAPTQTQLRGVMDRMGTLGHICTVKAITYLLLLRCDFCLFTSLFYTSFNSS